jgi:two-component system chemotaxis sensor kinase CheA
MDVSEYLPMFLAEAREHLQELNIAVVRIEENPDDRETVDEIFRIAHSLKGMSATMGFSSMAALTHQMEDVFELLRERSGGLDQDAITVLLQCLDAIEADVDAIEADGVENLDHEPLIARLKGLVDERADAPHQAPEGDEAPAAGDEAPEAAGEPATTSGDEGAPAPQGDAASAAAPAPPAAAEGGRRTMHVQVRLREDCPMPGVRAFMVLRALSGVGALRSSTPAIEGAERFDGRIVEAVVATDSGAEALRAAALRIGDVEAVEVEERATGGRQPAAASRPAAAGGKSTRKGGGTVRIDADRLDQLMHYMGELVVHRTHLEALVDQADVPGLSQAMQDLTRTSQALQAMVMQVRMIPVESVFMRFPRLVRDLSAKLGKQVDLRLTGKETELDRTVIEALGDPIVHLVRNSLDHGLESPEERRAAGKPETGLLEISARHAGGNVIITVRDDGRGIDPQAVAAKAVERGLLAPEAAAHIDAAQAIELLFTPGFSTAEQMSDISGRGVGMDAVRTAIRELGGEVEMTSEPGQGSTTHIRLPLTLAIMAALLVETGGLPFAIPIDRIERTLQLREHTVRSVAGRRMLVLRDSAIPLVDAASALGHEPVDSHEFAVIVHGSQGRVALAVQRLVGQRELVTRPLPPEVGDNAAVSGGAVLSDGSIALIVDCDAILEAGRPAALAAA